MSTDIFSRYASGKKLAIMEAALDEFAAKGYEAASTRDITQKAGVAHGLLFYYFKDKDALFLETLQSCLDILTEDFIDDLEQEGDYITRLLHIMETKIRQYTKYPLVYKLFMDSYFDEGHAITKRLHDMRARYAAIIMPMIADSKEDYRFRDDIDIPLAKRVIISAIQGMSEQYLRGYDEGRITLEEIMDVAMAEGRQYTAFFQKLLYKEAYS